MAVSPGHAFTIGALWLACCDVRIGEQGNFKYSMSEVALGVSLSAWPLALLKARLSPQQLIPAALHSRRYNPQQALEAGFIDQLVPEGQGLATTLVVAADLAKLSSQAYGLTKQQMRKQDLDIMATDLGAAILEA